MTPSAEDPRDLETRIQERQARIEKMQGELKRAEAFERHERTEKISTGLKMTALVVGVLLALSGGVWGVSQLSDLTAKESCNFHEHATFRVVDEGQVLSFQNPRFDMQHMAMRAHMHQPNDYQIHLEGGCATVREFFSLLGARLEPGELTLDDTLHDGKVLRDDGNRTLQFHLYRDVDGNSTWTPFPGLADHQLRNGQRMLVAYGNYTDEQLAVLQSRVPPAATQ